MAQPDEEAMSLVGFEARNHPQQTDARGARESVDDRATTAEVFAPLMDRFAFTIDVAASAHNAKCERYINRDEDGLVASWSGERVWCNPPYSDIRPWVEKAWRSDCPLIVMILPANRTEQGWWQDLVEPFRDRAGSPLTVEFMRGRLRFIAPGSDRVGPNERPPFGCCLLIWTRTGPDVQLVRQEELL